MHDFKVIGVNGRKKQEIFIGKKYLIPDNATHIRVRAGKISFGSSKMEGPKRRFSKIPNGMRCVSFNSYHNNSSGHHYGQPTWSEFKVSLI